MPRPDFPIPKHSQGNNLLETSRGTALLSAANLLETLSHARDLKRRAQAALEDRTRFDANDEGKTPRDFLFDMLRLNASYLNELAKLGSHHKDLVRRALDNLYSSTARSTSAVGKDRVLKFDLDRKPATFVVQNDVAPEVVLVELEWENVLTAHTPSADNPFVFAIPGTEPLPVDRKDTGSPHTHFCRIPVTFGVPTAVEMTLQGNGFLKRRYRGILTLSVPIGAEHKQVRRIPVEIDMRDKQSTEAGPDR